VALGLALGLAAAAEQEAPLAIEWAQWAPEKLAAELAVLRGQYRGRSPEELVTLLELRHGLTREDRPGVAEPELDEQLADLLYEWPSPELAAAVLPGLADNAAPATRHAALLAAGAVADDPAVAARLLALAQVGPPEQQVRALLALGQGQRPELTDQLAALPLTAPAARAAQATALLLRRRLAPPPLAALAPVPTTASVGRSLLEDYHALPQAPPGETTGVLLVDLAQTKLDAPLLDGLEALLRRGGTALLVAPEGTLPDALQRWAARHGVPLPSQPEPLLGPAVPWWADYRPPADFPYALRDQTGPPARCAWASWAPTAAAPIRAVGGRTALLVVDEQALGGRLLLTTVNLAERPIYRENLLRWLYGEALLAHAYEWGITYDCDLRGETPHRPWLRDLAGPPLRVLYLSDTTFKRGLLELHQRLAIAPVFVPYDATFAFPPQPTLAAPPSRMAQRAVALLDHHLDTAEVVVCEAGSRNLVRTLTSNARPGFVSLETVPARLRRRLWRRVHQDGLGLVVASSPRASEEPGFAEVMERVGADPKRRELGSPAAEHSAELAQMVASLLPLPLPEEDRRYLPAVAATRRGQGRVARFGLRLPHQEPLGLPPEWLPTAPFRVPGLLAPRPGLAPVEYGYAALARTVLYASRRLDFPLLQGLRADDRLRLTLATTEGTVRCVWRDAWGRVMAERTSPAAEPVQPLPALPSGWYVAEVTLLDAAGHAQDIAATLCQVDRGTRFAAVTPDAPFHRPGETARLAVRFTGPAQRLIATASDTWGRVIWRHTWPLAAGQQEATVEVPLHAPLSRLWDVELDLERQGEMIARWRQPIGLELPPPERDFTVTASDWRPEVLALFDRYVGVDTVFAADPEGAWRQGFTLAASQWAGPPLGLSPTPGQRLVPSEREPCLSSPAFRLPLLRDARDQAPRLRQLGIQDAIIADECEAGPPCYCRHCRARFHDWLRSRYATLADLNREWGSQFATWAAVQPLATPPPDRPGGRLDYLVFQRWVLAEHASLLELLVGDEVPGFVAGHSAGLRGSLMHHYSGLYCVYGVDEEIAGQLRPGGVLGAWFEPGYRFRLDHEAASRRWPWWHLLRGTTRMQLWWGAEGPPAFREELSRPYPAFVWLGEEMRELRQGLGKLVLHARREEGPVAVYLSERSRLATALLAELAGTPRPPAHLAGRWQAAVLARQVEARCLSEYQVEAGELARRGVRLLLLPEITTLSARERREVEQFVAAGGWLGADALPGTRNEHGTLVGEQWARELFANDRCRLVTEADLPALLAAAGCLPALSVRAADDALVPGDFGLYREGDAWYGGFVPGRTVSGARVTLPPAAHYYDCRAGRYLGQTATLTTDLSEGRAQFFAGLPWRLEGLTIAAPATVRRGQPVPLRLAATSAGPPPGLQVWRLTVTGGDGQPQPAHTQRLLVRGGAAELALPLALDAPPGRWQLHLRDAATGVATTADFEVTP
jgi:hypothetical protein